MLDVWAPFTYDIVSLGHAPINMRAALCAGLSACMLCVVLGAAKASAPANPGQGPVLAAAPGASARGAGAGAGGGAGEGVTAYMEEKMKIFGNKTRE
jgi:hypothetical protein